MKTALLLFSLLFLAGCSDEIIVQPEPQSANAFFEIIQGNTSIFAAYVNDTQYFYFTTDTVGTDFYLTGYTERQLHFNIMETDWHYYTNGHSFTQQIPNLEPNTMYSMVCIVE